MESRALLAVVLSILVLIAYQFFYVAPKMEHEQERLKAEKLLKKETPPSKPATLSPQPPTQKKEEIFHEKSKTSEVSASDKEQLLNVETPLYSATFSSKGAVIKSFKLKKYIEPNGLEVMLIKDEEAPPPLAIGDSRDFSFSQLPFTLSVTNNISLDYDSTSRLVFNYKSANVSIKRVYSFYGNSFRIELKDEVEGMSNYFITIGSTFGLTGAEGYGSHIGPVLMTDIDRIEFDSKKNLDSIKSFQENVQWIAREDKYFFASLVPLTEVREALVWSEKGNNIVGFRTQNRVNSFILFAGPKQEEFLKPLNKGLEHIIDFGFFSIIARPIFWLLKAINNFIGNYGWSIIILTILIRIPFIPLINKGQSSMKKLQKLQPLMSEIREKHKKNPQAMQTEMMNLYKKHKVNPMGGCLPILIQIPVFFALYKVLLIAIELRDAPFIFWISDLSTKDPYYILPLIMGASMFVQQKMTPTTMDPKQAKIMLFMPIIFTVMFLNFSSGLVLYWLISNLLSIIQQYYVNKKATIE